jgi:hypothetical protein
MKLLHSSSLLPLSVFLDCCVCKGGGPTKTSTDIAVAPESGWIITSVGMIGGTVITILAC